MRNVVFIRGVSLQTWAKIPGFLHQKVTKQRLGQQGTSTRHLEPCARHMCEVFWAPGA